jgi:nucleotide-binding universal stress UspA family protein
MSLTHDYVFPIIDRILHPTDFSEASRVAFHHALKAALIAKAQLVLLHVAAGDSREPMDFPAVRETLERWNLLPQGSPRSALAKLGIDICKVVARRRKPVEAVLHYLGEHPTDLIVLAMHQHEGRTAWLQQSIARPIARRSKQMTLFLPENSAPFVAAADGSVSLQNILIPVANVPGPQPAVEAAARLVYRMRCRGGMFTLLHVGEGEVMPTVQCPEVADWTWTRKSLTGDVIHGIVDTARTTKADLIVMSTDGRNGFLDALRGSHSERVLQQVAVPLLAVPAGSNVGNRLGMDAR